MRLFRRTWGSVWGKELKVGNNGDVVEILAQSDRGLQVRTAKGEVADIDWRRLADKETGRLLLGLGHALTIDAAQGLTSDEHINALPRGHVWCHRVHELRGGKSGARHHMDADLRRRTARGRAAPPGRRRRHANHAGHAMGARCRGHVRETLQGPPGIDLLNAAPA